MAKALQECPGSGVLWAEEILVAQRAEQKSESLVGVGERNGNHGDVHLLHLLPPPFGVILA